MSVPIYGFFHVSSRGTGYREVIAEQLMTIRDSDILENSDGLTFGYVGSQPHLIDSVIEPYRHPKMSLKTLHDDPTLFEQPTAHQLWQRCQDTKQLLYVYYIHAKGSYNISPNSDSWRKYMMYFNMERWRDCVAALEENDICGVNWSPLPVAHFSGNFWWARSDYIKTLCDPMILGTLDRRNIEFWHGGGKNVRVKSFHNSGIDHYHENYPRERYYLG